MATYTIHIFNPNVERTPGGREDLQEMIDYGDSRLRAAMLAISKADRRKVAWMQKTLQKELVSKLFLFLTYLMV